MATEKKETKASKKTDSESWAEKKVRVRLFRDNERYKEDVTAIVNGKAFRIRRGVDVELPLYVWLMIRNGIEQDDKASDFIQREEASFKAKEREFNW